MLARAPESEIRLGVGWECWSGCGSEGREKEEGVPKTPLHTVAKGYVKAS